MSFVSDFKFLCIFISVIFWYWLNVNCLFSQTYLFQTQRQCKVQRSVKLHLLVMPVSCYRVSVGSWFNESLLSRRRGLWICWYYLVGTLILPWWLVTVYLQWTGKFEYSSVMVKSVPLQAWSGPEGSRKLRFPDFMTMGQEGGKVVSDTHWPHLPPGNSPGTHFC